MRLAFQYHNTRNSTYYQSRSQRLRRAPFGATFDGREYVRDTGDDLVAFHKGHERAHNRAAYRNVGQAVLKVLGGQESGMFQRYIDKVDEHPQPGDELEQAQTEFLCDVFGAYVYGKATGKSVTDRLGLTDVEAHAFFIAFDEAMSGQAWEESDEVTGNKKVALSEHDVSGEPVTREESATLDLLDDRNVSRYRNEISATLDRTFPSWQNILIGKPPVILVEYMKSDNSLYMPQSAALKAALPETERGGNTDLAAACSMSFYHSLTILWQLRGTHKSTIILGIIAS